MKNNTSSNTVTEVLENLRLESAISQKVEEKIASLLEENTLLQNQLRNMKESSNIDGKFGTVRMQLQMLHFLGVLDKLKDVGTVEQKGLFFSALLNRHPQRARKPFSSINELTNSPSKAEAKKIRRDLIQVKELFAQFDLKPTAQKVQAAIDLINKKHFPEDL